MDSLNTLNNSGIQSAESISESAKQNLLLSQQLANQKKSEINEPLNMIGAELLTGGISGLGKSVAKRTGIKSFEKLGTEDLGKTLVNAGKEVSTKVIKKGGQVIKDKLGTNIDDYLKNGKKFAVEKINNELRNKGISAEINEGDLNDMKALKNKLNTLRQQSQKNVTDKLSEVAEDLKTKAEQTGIDANTAINDRFGKPAQGLKEKIQNDIREKQAKLQSTKERVESQARGRDVGEGIDDQDKATQKILGDLQESKAKSILKQSATGKRTFKFADPNIENVQNTIDDLPEFTKKVQQEVGAPQELGEAREVSLFDPLNKPFQKTFQNNIESEATLDDQDDIENTYVSKAQKAIQQSQIEANPVQKFIDTKPTFTAPKVIESQYLDQLPSLAELTETKDEKILRLQKEKVDQSISDKASEDLGKKPSDLFADDPKIKDPTTLTEGDVASLGKTTAKVKAQVEKKEVQPQAEDFDPKDLPPPPEDLLEPEKQALQLTESQISEPKITPQTVDEPEVEALQKEAPEVQKSEADAAKSLKPETTGLDEDIEDLGKADLAEGGEDVGGDILEGILGIASLVVPSELEGHGDLNSHNAIFSSSFQAGVTG